MHPLLHLHLLVFPPACRHCRRLMNSSERAGPGYPYLCAACHGGLDWKEPTRTCQRCGNWTAEPNRLRCPVCAERKMALDGVLAACHYLDPVNRWIRGLKYHRQDALAPMLGRLLAESPTMTGARSRKAFAADWVVPVPLHPRRIRARGFNQSYLLASHGLAAMNLQGQATPRLRTDLLQRHRNTKPQVEISGAERHANVADAFSIPYPAGNNGAPMLPGEPRPAPHPDLDGRSIVLVDDVMTTGATLNACAGALKAAGARKVTAWVLARL